ncbi:MAG TPA: sigma-70 family RNA polymerase sigma factor [Planctomycetaceae bacterium]|nr:sigma-70 family RNA polymerase sigma factor [Planctomycetaceae bacterium]
MGDDLLQPDSVQQDEGTRASLLVRLSGPQPGDRELAWSEFRTRYAPIIAGFAARCGANRQDIDDIVQDVLTAFLGASGKFVYDHSQGRFRGYLKTITVRAGIRLAGKNLRFQGVPLEDVSHAELAVEPLWNDVWEQQLVAQALEIVRMECADSVAFRAFEQYVLLDRAADIVAAELETSVNNVHQAKSRITKQLREAVQRLRAEDL